LHEAELFLLFIRPLNKAAAYPGYRSMVAISGDQIDYSWFLYWIGRLGLQAQWDQVNR